MSMKTDLPPIYAIIKIKKITLKDGKIATVSVETSYPLLPITHKMQLTRDDLIAFLRSGEQVSYRGVPWNLEKDGLINPIETPGNQVITPKS